MRIMDVPEFPAETIIFSIMRIMDVPEFPRAVRTGRARRMARVRTLRHTGVNSPWRAISNACWPVCVVTSTVARRSARSSANAWIGGSRYQKPGRSGNTRIHPESARGRATPGKTGGALSAFAGPSAPSGPYTRPPAMQAVPDWKFAQHGASARKPRHQTGQCGYSVITRRGPVQHARRVAPTELPVAPGSAGSRTTAATVQPRPDASRDRIPPGNSGRAL